MEREQFRIGAGSSLRHWPPGTNRNVRAVFFCARCFRMVHKGFCMKHWINHRWALGLAVFFVTVASYAQWTNPADDVPAYNPSAPLKVSILPPILSGVKLTGENFRFPWQVHVYQQAAKVGNIMYQLPCYCRCDRSLGHTSLRSCFEGLHGTECSTCAKEAFFTARQLKLGKNVTQIREAINRHEYESIDLEKQ